MKPSPITVTHPLDGIDPDELLALSDAIRDIGGSLHGADSLLERLFQIRALVTEGLAEDHLSREQLETIHDAAHCLADRVLMWADALSDGATLLDRLTMVREPREFAAEPDLKEEPFRA